MLNSLRTPVLDIYRKQFSNIPCLNASDKPVLRLTRLLPLRPNRPEEQFLKVTPVQENSGG